MAIFTSTIAAIDLLKQEYALGLTLAIAWLLIVIAEKKIFSPSQGND